MNKTVSCLIGQRFCNIPLSEGALREVHSVVILKLFMTKHISLRFLNPKMSTGRKVIITKVNNI